MSNRTQAQTESVASLDEREKAGSGNHEYVYERLHPNEIRLVKLHRTFEAIGAGQQNATNGSGFSLSLGHYKLEDAPDYAAISYTWGSDIPEFRHVATSDGKTIRVTVKLQDVLRKLSMSSMDFFWIDQICIDQNSVSDKWDQIRIMRHIYAGAQVTLLMLPDDGMHLDRFFAVLGNLETGPDDLGQDRGIRLISTSSLTSSLDEGKIHPLTKAAFENPHFISEFNRFCENPIFRRAWIYQEIVSSHHVILSGQTDGFNWDYFAKAFVWYLRLRLQDRASPLVLSMSQKAIDLIIRNRSVHQRGGNVDWMRLHVEAQGLLQASDPRDNTMALTTFETFYSAIPQYASISVAQLYKTTALAMIDTSRSLDVFGALAGRRHNLSRFQEGMSSWIPDWSLLRDSRSFYWPLLPTAFNAARGFEHVPPKGKEPEYRGDFPVLSVRGRVIDTIGRVVLNDFDENEKNCAKFFGLQGLGILWLNYAESQGHPLVTERTFASCAPIAHALIAAMTTSNTRSVALLEENFLGMPIESVLSEFTFMLAYHDDIEAGKVLYHQQKPHFMSLMPRMYGSWKDALPRLREWGNICVGRRIAFGGTQGMGLVPRNAQVDDLICILHGSKVPVVLRRVGLCYTVMGQCYWNNWMTGENVSWTEETAETFKLI